MIRIEIRSPEVTVKSGVATRTGKPYSIREQYGLVTLPTGEVRRVAISLEANDEPMAPGTYEPQESAFYVGGFDALSISMRKRHWRRADAAAVRKVG